jgi:excisionase family DNA binding protein
MTSKNVRHRYLPNLSAIADYLGCSKRTVQRLMRNAGLPVLSSGRNHVAALPERIDAWRRSRDEASAP